jgi:hypothetical protein
MSEMNVYLADVGRLLWSELIAGLASYGAVMCSIAVDLDHDC